ncbi:hypothetical protein BKK79_27090 [Cupriavidus sp. USMAA2-4]|uniref:type II RES/Xre toxin-antitoxin system antitoxin n=1 Tax=unclassified Cupriavidus TaxID=2640874 RepID=UPI0008A6EAAF|nr:MULTISPECIES: antitoxin Xre-like helix-turn-helix domain-containing protein [unclassified Cupriavidus]AOY95434.1 hypothetical protein BKK79_27090 [Cupriavidus sp. USMAA2-4]AOZ01646.1 hypothetical protein BKK81_19885 [Cupriavidus sp. USMAHM13]
MQTTAEAKPRRTPATRRAAPARHAVKRGTKHSELHGIEDFRAFYEASQSTAGTLRVIALIRAGIPASEIAVLAERMGLSKDTLMRTLQLPRATVDRKAKADERLSSDQSERVIGMAKLVGQVQALVERSGQPAGFNAAQWVAHWLDQPAPALGGERPADLMDTVAGQQIVADLLAKMESGAYA